MTEVSAAIIYGAQGHILLCQRGAGGSCAFLWEFPGGKREPGETPENCLIRECREELAIDIAVEGLFDRFSYQYPDREILFSFYEARILSGGPQKSVHCDLRWIMPADLGAYPLCPADKSVAEKLAAKF